MIGLSKKELLFSVTKDDCRWDYYRCPGKGGQKVNKTSSGVRCTHKASGAVGQSCDERMQHQNKKTAFVRMCETKEFKTWHRLEVARVTGKLADIERTVEREMKKVSLEVKDEKGRWVEVDLNDPLDIGESND